MLVKVTYALPLAGAEVTSNKRKPLSVMYTAMERDTREVYVYIPARDTMAVLVVRFVRRPRRNHERLDIYGTNAQLNNLRNLLSSAPQKWEGHSLPAHVSSLPAMHRLPPVPQAHISIEAASRLH